MVDDEKIALSSMVLKLQKIERISEVVAFHDPMQALEHLQSQGGADVAFLDINMGEIDGLQLGKQIKWLYPACHIIFITGYSLYAVEAFKMHAAGYLLKPTSVADIEAELDHIAGLSAKPAGKRLSVQCFGNFEVFAGGVPIRFQRSKTKELFAYLVDRKGASVTMAELVAVLWEDKSDSVSQRSQLRKLVSDLFRTLKGVGAAGVLVKNRGSLAVATDMLDCDFYRYLQGDAQAIGSFTGEYMTNYSWAEITLAYLC